MKREEGREGINQRNNLFIKTTVQLIAQNMQLPAERRRITLEKPTARGNSLTRGRKLSFTLRMKRLANRSQITVVSTLPPLTASNTLLRVFECLGQKYQRDRRITLPFMFSVSSFRISSSRVSHKTKLNARDRTECVLE